MSGSPVPATSEPARCTLHVPVLLCAPQAGDVQREGPAAKSSVREPSERSVEPAPPSAAPRMATVKLSSQEGEEFVVPVELAKLSETVKHIMEGRLCCVCDFRRLCHVFPGTLRA